MRTLPEREAEREQVQSRRSPWRTFRLLSIGGALVLLLLLVVALLLPQGTILALRDKAAAAAAPERAPQYLAMAIKDTLQATATLTTALPLEEGPEITLDQLPASADCTGCIHVWIIDRYERKGVGENWRLAVTYPDGQRSVFRVPPGGDFTLPVGAPPPGLCGGTYQIELEVPEGWEPITPASVPVTLTGTEKECAQVRFKVGLLPILKVTKRDAVPGPNGAPVGIPDWEMTVTDGIGIVLVGRTNGVGEVYFPLPHLGNWIVTEEAKFGWERVPPGTLAMPIFIAPPIPPTPTPWIWPVVFVNRQIREGCIEVIKKDSAGTPLNGWHIDVTRVDGTYPPQPGVTGTPFPPGHVVIGNLPMGDYIVTETVQPWWRPDPSIGAALPVTLKTPGACATVTFVNEPLGCIDGYKIDYLDRPLADWEIRATNAQTGDAFVIRTDTMGYFQFPDLPFGPYTVKEVVKDRWSAVTADTQQVNVVQQGPKCVTVRFKNIRDSACLEVFKGDVNDPNLASPFGYSGVAGIKITLQPAFGGAPIDVVTDGTGRAFFDNLTPGTYRVWETLTGPWVNWTPDTYGPFELVASEPCRPLGWTTPVVFLNYQETMGPPIKDPPPHKSTTPPAGSGCRAWYTVRAGNTLYSIARRYGSTVNRLMRANRICNANLIYVGQRLCIP